VRSAATLAAVSPGSAAELADSLKEYHARGTKLPSVDLGGLNHIVEFMPEDMTVTVEAGVSVATLQQELTTKRQWLPIDPPDPDKLTIHDLLALDLNGPRRFGYGTIREHVIGMKVVLADGRIIKSGGRVVKNVAGYDLAKLFIGAQGSLGIIVEATFKLRPQAEAEAILGFQLPLEKLDGILRAVLNSPLTPTVLDAHRVAPGKAQATVVLGFDGTRAEVESQVAIARELGFAAPASLKYDQDLRGAGPLNRASVLPSRVGEFLCSLAERPFVARAGNGVVYYPGDAVLPRGAMPAALMERVKAAYDPKRILAEFVS
jgi:glycolate oxidase FAD binding subunit